MSEDNFILQEAGGKEAPGKDKEMACGAACPLAGSVVSVMKGLLHRPFRKRHPVLFWIGILLVCFFCGAGVLSFCSEDVTRGDCIALVNVKGPIFSVSEQLEWITTLTQKENIKGVLVRVDSPGGGAAASQELYLALAKLAEKKPVVVSMGSMAASGGLMVSMAGERIFAGGSTVTGSIGVRMDIPQLKPLLDKIGIGRETLTTAPYKDAGSALRPLSTEEKVYFTGVLEDMHEQFVDIVAQGRHMTKEKAKELANGQIFTGRVALEKGLVDEIGGLQDAKAWLCQKTGVSLQKKAVAMPRSESWLQRQISSLLELNAKGLGAAANTPNFLYGY